jgi:ribose transport system ATP-binding protein
MMINRSIEQIYHKETVAFGPAIIVEARSLSGKGFEDVSMSGARRRDRRPLRPDRRRVAASSSPRSMAAIRNRRARNPVGRQGSRHPQRARRYQDLGMALAPESRRDQGLCLNLPVGLNLNLPVYKRHQQQPADHPASAGEEHTLTGRSADLRIKTPSAPRLGLQPCRAATSRRSSSANG